MTEKEFRVMVMEFIHQMDEKINNLWKNQKEMKSDIATIKNTMESFNSRLEEAEDRISELEDQEADNEVDEVEEEGGEEEEEEEEGDGEEQDGDEDEEAEAATGKRSAEDGAGGGGEAHRGNRGWQPPLAPADSTERFGSALDASSGGEWWLQLWVQAGLVLAVGVSGAVISSECDKWLLALIAPKEQGEVE
ncbi:hypothetical protein QTO34_000745 [Cnephaeus nilssonii]|uniref:Prothymosin alpha n=1 Tax=Cnephaeus nilssonii TaxID=3371016 RepID=A0AA40IC70_CNENI|nr:hypothetical protein QTO34_000745 [Eptesicus nilssonii]